MCLYPYVCALISCSMPPQSPLVLAKWNLGQGCSVLCCCKNDWRLSSLLLLTGLELRKRRKRRGRRTKTMAGVKEAAASGLSKLGYVKWPNRDVESGSETDSNEFIRVLGLCYINVDCRHYGCSRMSSNQEEPSKPIRRRWRLSEVQNSQSEVNRCSFPF